MRLAQARPRAFTCQEGQDAGQHYRLFYVGKWEAEKGAKTLTDVVSRKVGTWKALESQMLSITNRLT